MLNDTNHSQIYQVLRNFAPYSVVDRGYELFENGSVIECTPKGNEIIGKIIDNEESIQVSFSLISGKIGQPKCDGFSFEDLDDQWTKELIALGFAAHQNGLLDDIFKNRTGTGNINTTNSTEIAKTIKDISGLANRYLKQTQYLPEVKVELDLSQEPVGIKVLFDGESQSELNIFEKQSDRALDNLLLEVLNDQAMWNEVRELWEITSASSLRMLMGLVREFKNVTNIQSNEPVLFSKSELEGTIVIEWKDALVELKLLWKLAQLTPKNSQVVGPDQQWTIIGNTIYRLSNSASKLACLFPFSNSITIGRSESAPLLEVLSDATISTDSVNIVNPEQQPECKSKNPEPTLELERVDKQSEHFSTNESIEIQGNLQFKYPEPPKNKNIVYLPNRELEGEYQNLLSSIGFEIEDSTVKINGDDALDLAYNNTATFDKAWKISGLKEITKQVKFSSLVLDIRIKTIPDDGNYFDCEIGLLQNSSSVPLSTLFKSFPNESSRWIKLDNGSFAKVPLGTIGHLTTSLGMLVPNFKFQSQIKTKITVAQAITFTKIDDASIRVTSDEKIQELAQKLRDFSHIKKVTTPKTFEGKLRPYQLEGVSWMSFLNDYGFDGILADEMGLGKTVQTLALIQKLKENGQLDKPALVVAPTSVITNWSYEATKFTPNLRTAVLHGSARKNIFKNLSEFDLLITSYALLRIDKVELEKQEYSYIILDEAQNIKNPQAITSKSAKALKSRRRLALTGTPTENRPLELWSLLDFLMPGYLGTLDFFRQNIERPILEQEDQHQIISFLNSKTRPFILRRLKKDVEKDLPPKIESELHVSMTSSQKQLYNQILEEVRPKIFDVVDKKGIQGATISILAALLRLRQVCNHPNSIDSMKQVEGFDSGKFKLLQELITEGIQNNRKILVFSQFREMLSIIKHWIEEQKINHLYLDGTTKNRQDLVDKFNADDSVRLFLISLKAGGTGLNLTAADMVVIYDPWWNPAVESQAIDRAHRIGQTKAVSVYRLITEDSIEQKIMTLKSKKSALIDALINENGLSGLKLTKTDLENFFNPLPND